jgi:hypothetical protein
VGVTPPHTRRIVALGGTTGNRQLFRDGGLISLHKSTRLLPGQTGRGHPGPGYRAIGLSGYRAYRAIRQSGWRAIGPIRAY